jgi:ERCC4-type nuclease
MIPPLFIDTFEPVQIEQLLAQSVQVTRTSLVNLGLADYCWIACDGHKIQIERKQINEILADIDGVEEQLTREFPNADESMLLVEGLYEASDRATPQIQTFRHVKDKAILVPSRTYDFSYGRYQSWKSSIDKCGITIVETSDYRATAITIVALFKNSLDPDRRTMKRYIKEKIFLEEKNPQVAAMIALGSAYKVEIGEKKAKALIARYKTVWAVLQQDPEELAETEYVGKGTARKLLEAVGRRDID